MLIQVGDAATDTFLIAFQFDEVVLADMGAAVPTGISVTYMGMASFAFAISSVTPGTADPTGMTVLFDVAQFAGPAVAAGDIFTVNGVMDLSGNAAFPDTATLGLVGTGVTIGGTVVNMAFP